MENQIDLIRNFTPFPVLTTERLTLRQLATEDEQGVFTLRSDRTINKYLGRVPSKSIEDAKNFIRMIDEKINKNESIYWAITLTDRKEFVGTICLFEFSGVPDKCEIGYELLPNFQGQGIMTEATKKVLEYAVQAMHIQIIDAFAHKDNQSSIKLLDRFGFKKAPKPDDTNPDYCVFALTAPYTF